MPNANASTVDERIVEMRINNQKFESGAKKTLGILEKLDAGLKSLGKQNTGGIDDVSSSLDKVASKFSYINTIQDQIVRNLTNKVMGALDDVIKKVNELSIAQIGEGWNKYADKTQGVQTIMAATSKDWDDQAAQMEYVNGQLERLNWFTDETSYNFLDMVNNIGKFTSNGVKLDTAVTAMEGIATWAGLSGANTQEASRAMYNLSQALATGSVKLIDWKSIENANMATREFKETALETAADLKMLIKLGNGTWKTLSGKTFTTEQFNTELSEGWFSSEVLLQTLQKYGDFTDELQIASDKSKLTASEFLSAMEAYKEAQVATDEATKEAALKKFNSYVNKSKIGIDELIPLIEKLNGDQYELGRRAFKAAQEAKTFKEAIDATKDAVSTGWMNIFEKIFGDYLKAKEFWTDVAESLYNIFAEPINDLNGIIDVAFGEDNGLALITGQQLFTEGLMNILHIIETINNIVRDALGLIFGDFDEGGGLEYLGEMLYYSVEKFNRLTKVALNFIDSAAEPLSIALAYIFSVVRTGFGFVSGVFRKLISAGFSIFKIIQDLYSRLSENGAILIFLNAFYDIFYAITVPIQIASDYIKIFFDYLRSLTSNIGGISWLQTIADWILIIGAYFSDLAARFRAFMESGAWLASLIAVFNGLKNAVGLVFGFIISLFIKVKNVFQSGGILGVLQAIGNKIREFLQNNPLLLRGFEILKTVLGAIVGLVFVAISSVGSLFTKFDFSKLKINLPFIDKISNFFGRIKDVLKLKFSGIIAWFESFKHFEIFGRLSEKIKTVFDSIKNFFSGLKPDFSGFSSFFGSIKDFFSNAFENLFSDTEKIKIAISNFVHAVFGFLADTLKNMSLKDIIDVLKIGLILTKIGRVFTFISFLTKMKKQLTSIPEAISGAFEELGGMFKNIGKSFQGQYFLRFAIAIGIISAAIFALSYIPEDRLMRATAVVAVIGIILNKMIEITTGKKIYNKQVDIKKFQLVSDMAGVLIGIALIIVALGYAIGRIANSAMKDPGAMWSAFVVMLILIAELGAFMIIMVKQLNKIKTYQRIDAIGDTLLRVGETMAIIAIAIRLLVKPLLQIANAIHKNGGDGSITGAFFAITGFAAILGGLTLALLALMIKMEDAKPARIKALGNTMLKFGASMAIMAVSIKILAKPLLDIASAIHRYKDNSVGAAAGLLTIFALALGGIIVGLVFMFAKIKDMTADKIKAIGITILEIAAGMAILAVGIRILMKPLVTITGLIAKYNITNVVLALSAIIILALAFATIFGVLAKTSNNGGMSFLVIGAGMALFAVGLALLLPPLIAFVLVIARLTKTISTIDKFEETLDRLFKLSGVMLVFAIAVALFGVGIVGIGLGFLTASASLLIFAAGIYVLVAALDKVGPSMKSFVQGMIDAGSLITKENAVDLLKGVGILVVLALAVWGLSKALGVFDFSKLGKLGTGIGALAGTLLKSVGGVFAKLGETLVAHLPSIQTLIISLITIIGLFVLGAMRPLVNMIGGAIISLIANIYLYIQNNKSVFEYYIFNLVAELMNILNDALTWALSMIIPSLIQLVGSAISDFIRSIPIKGDEWANAFDKKLAESNLMPSSEAMQEKLQRSFGRNEDFWNSVNPFGNIPPEVHEVTEKQASALGIDYKTGIEEAKETALTELRSVKDDMTEGYTDVLGGIFSTDSSATDAVTEGATDTADIGVDSLLGELGLRSDDISDAGLNVSSTLANSMLSGLPLVTNAAEALADEIPETMNGRLRIASPSKVMAKLAAWIPAGIARGINDNADEAENSVTILSSAILAAMEEAMLRVATVADENFEYSPVITPVVDTSNIDSATDRLTWLENQYKQASDAALMKRWDIMTHTRELAYGTASIVNRDADNAISYGWPAMDNNNDDVVTEIKFLTDRVDNLGTAISNMKIVLDTGLLVGATSSKMNSALGVMQMRSGRGN